MKDKKTYWFLPETGHFFTEARFKMSTPKQDKNGNWNYVMTGKVSEEEYSVMKELCRGSENLRVSIKKHEG